MIFFLFCLAQAYVLFLRKVQLKPKPFLWAVTVRNFIKGLITYYANVNIELIGSNSLVYHWCIAQKNYFKATLCTSFTKDTVIAQKSDFTVNYFPNQTSKTQYIFMVTIKKSNQPRRKMVLSEPHGGLETKNMSFQC